MPVLLTDNVCMKYKICTLFAGVDNGYSGRGKWKTAPRSPSSSNRRCRPSSLPHSRLAADFAKASKAKATQAAYESDFRIFESWCHRRALNALPATPATLCAFLADEASAGRRASTLGRRLAAVRHFHRAAGYDTPTRDEKGKQVLSGVRLTI